MRGKDQPHTAIVFVLVWFSNLQRFVCLDIIKYLISKTSCCFVRRVLFPEEIDRDYSQLPVVRRLFGPWAVRAVLYGDV